MDIFDRATELETAYRENALASHCESGGVQQSLSACVDCGKDIPIARQRTVKGCCRCIACQEAFERVI